MHDPIGHGEVRGCVCASKRGCVCAIKRTGRCVGCEEGGMVHDLNPSVRVGVLLVKRAGWCVIRSRGSSGG